jgi:ABC-type multidrug transport system ATPase subunit
MTDFAVQTDSLTRRFRRTLAVDGASLRLPSGSVNGYLGRNGASKTTMIQMLMGMLSPTSGTLCTLGMNPSPESDRAAGGR